MARLCQPVAASVKAVGRFYHCPSLFHCHRWRGGASSNKLHDVTSDYCCLDVHIHTYYLFICTFMFLIMKLFYYWCLQLCCADDVCNRSFKSSFRNLKFHTAVSLTTVWLRVSMQVLKIDMKRYRQALAVNDSSRDTDRPGAPWGILRPAGTSLGLLRPAETGWTYTCNHLAMLSHYIAK